MMDSMYWLSAPNLKFERLLESDMNQIFLFTPIGSRMGKNYRRCNKNC